MDGSLFDCSDSVVLTPISYLSNVLVCLVCILRCASHLFFIPQFRPASLGTLLFIECALHKHLLLPQGRLRPIRRSVEAPWNNPSLALKLWRSLSKTIHSVSLTPRHAMPYLSIRDLSDFCPLHTSRHVLIRSKVSACLARSAQDAWVAYEIWTKTTQWHGF